MCIATYYLIIILNTILFHAICDCSIRVTQSKCECSMYPTSYLGFVHIAVCIYMRGIVAI